MKHLSLKDALFLGFCAVLIIAARAALRLHLKIPGHSMLFTLFFMLLARGCVRKNMAASFTALLAGIMAIVLGMGKGGPLVLVKYLLPALMVDAIALLLVERLFQSTVLCVLTAALAASTRFISDAAMDLLAGMELSIVVRHAGLQTASNVVFGSIGALGVPAVLRKLRAFGAIEPS